MTRSRSMVSRSTASTPVEVAFGVVDDDAGGAAAVARVGVAVVGAGVERFARAVVVYRSRRETKGCKDF